MLVFYGIAGPVPPVRMLSLARLSLILALFVVTSLILVVGRVPEPAIRSSESRRTLSFPKVILGVPGTGPAEKIELYRGGFWEQNNYIGYLNGSGDAFRNATETLTKRVEQFGADSPSIRHWVRAKDQVFANCNGPAKLPKMHEYWLSPEQQAAKEAAAVPGASIPARAPPDYLGGRVIAWAKNHPDDPRLPEALHRVVNMPHLGCSDTENRKQLPHGFRFLHEHYPNSPWTKKAKYWYH